MKEKNHESESFLVFTHRGDGHYLGTEEGAPVITAIYGGVARQQTAWVAGVLMPTGRSCEDAWLVAASIIPVAQAPEITP
ncbi:hypothetical protein ACNKHO_06085 [Shigella flexneri]